MKTVVREVLRATIQYGFGAAPFDEDDPFADGPALLFREPTLETYNEMPSARQVRRWVWENRHRRVLHRPGGFLWAFHEDNEWVIGFGALVPRSAAERAQALFPDAYTEL